MPTTVITNWGDALMTGLASGVAMFMAAIPKVIGALFILLIGWLISLALASLATNVLRKAGFDRLAERTGLSRFFQQVGINTDASGVIGKFVYWFFFLISLAVAIETLDIPAVNAVINAFLLWLPNLAVALVVLLIAYLIAGPIAGLVRGAVASAGVTNPGLFGGLAKAAIWIFAIVIAANQVQIADTLVNTLFIGFVAATALALGLAFGLGGRETASLLLRHWYQSAGGPTMTYNPNPVEPQRREPPEEPRRIA